MAIALDSTTQNTGSGSLSHTVSGTNRILFVSVLGGAAFGDNISGVTYNGDAMSLAGKSATSGDRWNYLFYLIAPDTGTNTVSISDGGLGVGATVATSYTGVNQGALDASGTTSGVGTSQTGSLTTTVDSCWLVGAMHVDIAPTAGAGTTFRGDRFYDSNGSVGTAGSHSLALTWVGSVGWSYILASIAPAGASPSSQGNMLMVF